MCCIKAKLCIRSTGLAEMVWLLRFWPDQFSQGNNELPLLQIVSIKQKFYCDLRLVRLIILSYNR